MDKNGDERLIISGPNKKPHLLISGNVEKDKLGKHKVKRLIFLGGDMGFEAQDNTTVTSLKFKLPKKIFSDSNACVPRKLRSAIKKRSCESGSTPLPNAKRLNNRVNCVESLLGSNCLKNSKISMQNGKPNDSSRQTVPLEISKDEEEVAETLFALAGMIPLDVVHKESKTSNESFEAKSSELLMKQHSEPTPSSEDIVIQKEAPVTNIHSSNRLSERRQLNVNWKIPVPPPPFQIPPLLRACDDKKLSNATFFGSTEQNQESMLNKSKLEIFQLHKRESHINLGIAELAANQDRNNETSIQALTSKLSHDSGVDGVSVRSNAVIYPSWLNNSSSSLSGSVKDALSASKVSCSMNAVKKSWKRCIAHVRICRLIQGMQTSEGKDMQPLDTSQMRPSQCPAVGNNDDRITTFAAGHMFGPGSHKIENCQIKEEGSSLSSCCDIKKQSYNFMSLSTGAAAEVNNSVNRLGITFEAKDHVLQLHYAGQNDTYIPCSTPQHHFPSLPYRDQAALVSVATSSLPPQVNLQLPPVFGSPCGPTHMGATTRSTQQPHSKQQQMWTAQLASQFREGPFLSSHVANWKNGTLEAHSMNHNRSPRPSQEMMGANYLQISQQPQQQLFGICQSLPSTSRAKIQNSQLPSICEDKGGRFHPDGVFPMQLLCNDRLLS